MSRCLHSVCCFVFGSEVVGVRGYSMAGRQSERLSRVLLSKGPIEDYLLLCVKFTFLSNSTRVVHVTATFVVGLHKSNLIVPVSSCSHNVTVLHLF